MAMQCRNDGSLGPAVEGCRDDFDFTITFENIILTIVPASVFAILAIGRLLSLRKYSVVVDEQYFGLLKLAIILCLVALQAALLGYAHHSHHAAPNFNASAVVAAALNLTVTVIAMPLSWFEHSRSARPSVLLAIYFSITLLFDITKARTAWLVATSWTGQPHAQLTTSASVIKALCLVLESQQKSRWLTWEPKEHSPEETSGFYSLGAFFWLNKLFMRGFRGVLSNKNLYPLDKALTAETMRDKFMEQIRTGSWKGRRWGLAGLVFRTLATQIILAIPPRVALLAASLCQPLLINALLSFLQKDVKDENHGYGLIAATGLTYTAIALSSALYTYLQERFLIMMRGCLVVAVYEQTTSLQLSASEESGALTVMSTDVELIMRGFRDVHEYWANLIQIGLSCWLLQRELGAAFAAPLVVVIISTLGAFFVGTFLGPRQRAWMEAIQTRISITTSAVTQMKLIKMSGMTGPIQSYIQGLRVTEIAMGGRWRTLLGIVATLSHVPLAISPVMTFAVSSRTLDTATIFVSISYLTLLAAPLMVVFQKLPQLMGALTCLNRIQNFLEREVRLDGRRFSADSKEPYYLTTLNNVEMRPLPNMQSPAMTMKDGCIAWGETIVLRDVNFTVTQSHMATIVGPVASGKTTLCKALLGELPLAQGAINFRSRCQIGYCSQQPFLTNDTVRNNVVGFEGYDHERYNSVLKATMLDRDIDTFSKGDETAIGSDAITLSGGQRQRLAIARALYAKRTDFFIFDDVLSGLDSKTEQHVLEHVFGHQGILRRRKATVLLCTHKVSHLDLADQVLRLQDGTISTQETGKLLDVMDEESTQPPQQEEPSHPTANLTSALEEDETRRLGDFTVYKHYFRTVGLKPVVVCLLAATCHGFLLNFPKVWLTFWSDDAARDNPVHSQAYYVGIYGLLEVLYLSAFVVAGMTVLLVFIKVSGAALHHTALETVVNAPLRLFTQTDAGTIVNYFAQDMTLIDGEMPLALLNLILDIVGVIGMSAVLASSAPWLALAYPGMVAVLWFIQSFYLKTSRQLRLLDLEAKAPLYSHFMETLKGLATVRAFGWEEDNKRHSRKLLDQSQRPAYLLGVVQRWLFFVLNMVVAVVATILVALITQLRGSSSSLSGASLVTLMSLSSALSDIVRFYAMLETSIGAVARLRNFTSSTGSETNPQQVFSPDPQWPWLGSITMENVSASYSETGEGLALSDVNVAIKPGEKVAVCGRTGSGKSSLILLLLGLLEPLETDSKASRLLVDDIPLSAIKRQHLRQHLMTVPQDPVFLHNGSTIAQNLDPMEAASREQLRSVVRDLNLHDAVEAQGGLDSPLAVSTLSQGQRQIFNLARAVLKRRVTNRRVLLLDEFTSSVDSDTERAMLDIVRREFRDCTVIMIAHRLDMVLDHCDRVLVMNQGIIVEDGDPRVLKEMDGSWFAALLDASLRH